MTDTEKINLFVSLIRHLEFETAARHFEEEPVVGGLCHYYIVAALCDLQAQIDDLYSRVD